jgi:hypothetical protein
VECPRSEEGAPNELWSKGRGAILRFESGTGNEDDEDEDEDDEDEDEDDEDEDEDEVEDEERLAFFLVAFFSFLGAFSFLAAFFFSVSSRVSMVTPGRSFPTNSRRGGRCCLWSSPSLYGLERTSEEMT